MSTYEYRSPSFRRIQALSVGLIFLVAPFLVYAETKESIIMSGGTETIESGEEVVVNGNNQSIQLTNGSELIIPSGATLTVQPANGYVDGGQKLLLMDGIWKDKPDVVREPSKIVIDGGTMNAPLTFWKLYDGVYLKYGILSVKNGGRFIMERPKNSPGMPSMFLDGASQIVVDEGGTFSFANCNTPDKSLLVGGSASIDISGNSLFNYYNIMIGGCANYQRAAAGAHILFENSTVTTDNQESGNSAVTIYGNAYETKNNEIRMTGDASCVQMNVVTAGLDSKVKDNIIKLEGGTHTGTVSFPVGTNNKYVQSGGEHSGDATTGMLSISGGTGNSIELTGGTCGGVISITGGTNNRYIQSGGQKKSAYHPFLLGGVQNEFVVTGGEFGEDRNNGRFKFAEDADSCSALFRDSKAYFVMYGGKLDMSPIVFAAGSRNCEFVVSSNAVVRTGCPMDFSATCEGCAIAFEGDNPKIEAWDWSFPQTEYNCVFGSSESVLNGKTVALKFILPESPYPFAPFDARSNKPLKIYPNTKIIIDAGDWKKVEDKTKSIYPLIFDNMNFNGEMTPELVAALNANAELPEDMELVYRAEQKGGTLCVKVPRKPIGLLMLFR